MQSNNRISLFPKKASGVDDHHMYAKQQADVMACLISRTCKGCIPSPSNSSSLALRFISEPKNCDRATSTAPLFLAQNL